MADVCVRCGVEAQVSVDIEPLRDWTPELAARVGLEPGHDIPLCYRCAMGVMTMLKSKKGEVS